MTVPKLTLEANTEAQTWSEVQVILINSDHNQVVTKGIGQENCENTCAQEAACHPGWGGGSPALAVQEILGLSSLLTGVWSCASILSLEQYGLLSGFWFKF